MIEKYGERIVVAAFGLLLLVASLFAQTYSNDSLGDPMGYALREEPVWWMLVLSIVVIVAAIRDR